MGLGLGQHELRIESLQHPDQLPGVQQGGTPGAYLASFNALAQLPDLWISEIKAVIYGFVAGIVAAYRGLNPSGGPKGVGDAVNRSVVITFMLLFALNFVVTAVYFQVVPQKGS